MTNFINGTSDKVSTRINRPPGGGSSLNLGWQQHHSSDQFESVSSNTKKLLPKKKSLSIDEQLELNSREQKLHHYRKPSKQSHKYEQHDNSLNLGINQHNSHSHPTKNNHQPTSSSQSTQQGTVSQYLLPIKKKSSPISKHLIHVEPLNMNLKYQPNKIPSFRWDESAKQLEDELRYYQEKNRLLNEQLSYKNIDNSEKLKYFQGDYKGPNWNRQRGRGSIFTVPDNQLYLGPGNMPQNIGYDQGIHHHRNAPQAYPHYQGQHQMRQNYQNISDRPFANHLRPDQNQFIQEYHSSNLNEGIPYLMNNDSDLKTSVKVHNPPGGRSSIQIG